MCQSTVSTCRSIFNWVITSFLFKNSDRLDRYLYFPFLNFQMQVIPDIPASVTASKSQSTTFFLQRVMAKNYLRCACSHQIADRPIKTKVQVTFRSYHIQIHFPYLLMVGVFSSRVFWKVVCKKYIVEENLFASLIPGVGQKLLFLFVFFEAAFHTNYWVSDNFSKHFRSIAFAPHGRKI